MTRSFPAHVGAAYYQKKQSYAFVCRSPIFAMSALWDYENWLLSRYNLALGMPVGLERLTHEPWVRHVQKDLPNSDFTWEQYVAHVEANDGDDWFFESPQNPPAAAPEM